MQQTHERATDDIAAAAKRLRASRQEERAADSRRGFEAGTQWALETARVSELDQVLELSNSHWLYFTISDDDSEPGATLGDALGVDWEHAGDSVRIERDTFSVAFLEGAAGAYGEMLEAESKLED